MRCRCTSTNPKLLTFTKRLPPGSAETALRDFASGTFGDEAEKTFQFLYEHKNIIDTGIYI